ncbi:DUF2852 domain-containing protein [Wenxinia marina]|uniref:DUF2852 domain-containing protein n=1 Tax=Wenxinia marina DSM 24838 TaxID=1123501 RepID=A0A0D0Q5J2_9RHOB|nr:DUF2852 domain-containing protein [Wenxinia marina]KIQ69739.1 hypothetical protein Wenmar_01309 [Wenxinia marina DSM 24838]GGL60816.1 hypothetical protein GCM10011392_14090 [Wenxinia marina]
MSTTDIHPQSTDWRGGERDNLLARAEGWLDDRGKGAWIAAMILGFIAFWPIGLALLAYMIWSKRMFNGSCARRGGQHSAKRMHRKHGFRTSGNSAFDSYRSETLRRLEDEQDAFEAFLERLRSARDKAEFDQFMDERSRRGDDDRSDDGDSPVRGYEPPRSNA